MRNRSLYLASFILLTMTSCVSKKKLEASEKKYNELNTVYRALQNDLNNCNTRSSECEAKAASDKKQIDMLEKQNNFLKDNNTRALKELENMSVISGTQAESIKKSLENIGAKDAVIQSLQSELAKKDSLNLILVQNLKGAIGDLSDQDINIKIDKDVVYIDISDKLLFESGSYTVTPRAKIVLGKVAAVLKNQPDIEFMVEGNTDNIPYHRGVLLDNWDLSVKRATSVVRILQNQYGLTPSHISASGRSEYTPVATNDTPDGRALNRRTRIIILPQLDQFFKLLEKK
jgi:chemotaxis protein MotB